MNLETSKEELLKSEKSKGILSVSKPILKATTTLGSPHKSLQFDDITDQDNLRLARTLKIGTNNTTSGTRRKVMFKIDDQVLSQSSPTESPNITMEGQNEKVDKDQEGSARQMT